MIDFLIPYLTFQYALFSVLMFLSKKAQNRYLGIAFLTASIGYFLSNGYAIHSTWLINHYTIGMSTLILSGLIGVAARYLFFSSLVNLKLQKSALIGVFLVTLLIISIIIYSGVFSNYADVVHLATSPSYLLISLLIFGYCCVTYVFIIRKIRKRLANNRGNLSFQSLLLLFWGRYYLMILLFLSASQMLILISFQFPILYSNLDFVYYVLSISENILIPLVTIIAIAIAYFALRNPLVFELNATQSSALSFEQRISEAILPSTVKNAKLEQQISEERFQEIVTKINKSIQHKTYLKNDISIQSLADELEIPKYQLSFTINKQWNKKFNDFINSYRIEHAIRLMNEPKNKEITMYAVAFESGFNSESTFYSVFKKETGKTPKEFREIEVL